jgi:GntR family transcriptional regulator
VRKAIDEMAAENLLVRQSGQGDLRRQHKTIRVPSSAFSVWCPIRAICQVSQSVPLECWRAKAGADVARILALETGRADHHLRRLLKLGDEPVVFDEIYLPSELFPDLSLEVLRSGRVAVQPVRDTLWRAHDPRRRAPARGIGGPRQRRTAAGGRREHRCCWSSGDFHLWFNKPVEWRRGFYSTRNYHYHNELG